MGAVSCYLRSFCCGNFPNWPLDDYGFQLRLNFCNFIDLLDLEKAFLERTGWWLRQLGFCQFIHWSICIAYYSSQCCLFQFSKLLGQIWYHFSYYDKKREHCSRHRSISSHYLMVHLWFFAQIFFKLTFHCFNLFLSFKLDLCLSHFSLAQPLQCNFCCRSW